MLKDLYEEQKEDLFNLVQKGCADSEIRNYCSENNVSYGVAQSFIAKTKQYLDKNN